MNAGGRGGGEIERRAEPRPLVEQGGEAGAFLVAAHAAFEPRLGEEARAWAALARRRGRHRWQRLLVVAGGGALVVGLAVLAMRAEMDHHAPPPVVAAPAPPPPVPAPSPSPEAPPAGEAPARDTAASAPMAAGPSVVGAGVRAQLSAAGRATVLPGAGEGARIVLERGTLEIDADADAQPVEVRVAAYRLSGEPGRFKISAHPGAVDLAVQRGEVAVWLESRRVARVFAGQRWTDQRPAARADARPSLAEAPPAPGEPRDCARAPTIDDKVACLEQQAGAAGLDGETALLELARTRRDVTGDLSAAERTLGQYLRRFPRGSFVAEAAGMRVELLLQLGRLDQALTETDHLPGAEGIFWRAVCLAQLGRKAEALRAFDDYLARPDGQHRKEAARKRQELGEIDRVQVPPAR
jgi:hypothetical protein